MKAAVAAILLLSTGGSPVLAGCAFQMTGASRTIASTINYVGLNAPAGVMDAAIQIWSTDCAAGFGRGFPELVSLVGTSPNEGIINIIVDFQNGPSTGADGSCGETRLELDPMTNQISGGTITLWASQRDGTSCCESYAEILAHEIGHTLNLDDVSWNPACNGTIMGNNPGYVSGDQCDLADFDWLTFRECPECRDWTRDFQCKY